MSAVQKTGKNVFVYLYGKFIYFYNLIISRIFLEHSLLFYLILFFAAFCAGLVDSIAGGGGLITVPVLLGIGLPPHIALGTNKFQSSFGSFTATYYYVKKNIVELKTCLWGIVCTFIGAAAGVLTVQQIDAKILNYIIPVMLIVIIVYTLVKPNVGEKDRKPLLTEKWFYALFGLALGFYDGFFGPGTGSFWAIAFVVVLGYNFKKATGYTKVMNFVSNIVSLILFTAGGYVVFGAAFVMAAGQIAGSKVGANLVIKKGAKLIRPIFIGIVILTTLKIIYDRLL